MAHPFDAVARLGEGRPAVDDVSEYVLACSRVGFQHQDLTTHPGQVRDWYGSEDGLDLRALDVDCTALAAAAVAAEDAARTHVALVAELSGSWSGRGAVAAGEFATRSNHAATTVSSAVRGAADALTVLRDELWRSIDAKVATVQTIDGRHEAQRAQWLAAARAVTTGSGDLASASEFVEAQVMPFVANDIASEWLGAMRAAAVAIGAAYDAAIVRTSTGSPAVFDVPGVLGPRAEPRARPPSCGEAPATGPAAASVPATGAPVGSMVGSGSGWTAPAALPSTALPSTALPSTALPSTPMPPAAMPSAETSPAAMSALDPTAGAPSMGGLGGAAPALGSGGSGFGQQLADLIGGLIGSFGGTDDLAGPDAPPDESIDDPAASEDDPDNTDDPDEDPDETDETDDQAEPESAEDVVGKPVDGPVEQPVDPAVDPTAPPPATPPPPTSSLPPPPPPAPDISVSGPVERTSCEIAADELPQVGE